MGIAHSLVGLVKPHIWFHEHHGAKPLNDLDPPSPSLFSSLWSSRTVAGAMVEPDGLHLRGNAVVDYIHRLFGGCHDQDSARRGGNLNYVPKDPGLISTCTSWVDGDDPMALFGQHIADGFGEGSLFGR